MSKTSELQNGPQPPILKRDGFQFRKGVFSVDGIDRISGRRRESPSAIQKYYGIPFQLSLKIGELQLLLKDAVLQGKCNHVPKSVVDLEASMRADYEPVQQQWEADCTAWSTEKKRRDDEAFQLCKTPGERAAFDVHRFMNMYFLTDGKPDKTKTTKALALSGFRDTWKLDAVAWKVPDLHTCNGGYSPDQEICCIGWDRAEVTELANGITDRENEANEGQQKAMWEKQLERHRKYVTEAESTETNEEVNKRPVAFNLDRCQGSYIVRCDGVTKEWLHILKGHTLTMDICSGEGNTLRASYDFGIIVGTMILSLSEDALEAIVGEEDMDSEAPFSDEDDEEEDNQDREEDDEDGIDVQESTGGKKRKPGEASLVEAAGSAVMQRANAKRRKITSPSPSRRVYLWLRGRETGEGEVLPEPEPGHIDFLSDGCATFAGLMYTFPCLGENVKFQGYKVADEPQVQPRDWEAFSYGADYEYVTVGGWP